MKRITWVPVVASVVLLLIAFPIFAGDIVNAVGPQSPDDSSSMVQTLSDQDFSIDDYELRGGGCESEVTNPF